LYFSSEARTNGHLKIRGGREILCNPFYHLGIFPNATPFGLRALSRPEVGFLWVVVSLFALGGEPWAT
jgi:hypothetical protein